MKTALLLLSCLLSSSLATAKCVDVDCGTWQKGARALELKNVRLSLAEKIALLRSTYPNLSEEQVADVVQVYTRQEVARGFQAPKLIDIGVDFSRGDNPNADVDGNGTHIAGAIPGKDQSRALSDDLIQQVRKVRPELSYTEIEAITKIIE